MIMIDRDAIARLLPEFHAARLAADAAWTKHATLESLLAEQEAAADAATNRLSELRKKIVAATGKNAVMYKVENQLYALMPDDLTDHAGPIEIDAVVFAIA
jgi:uncharacterized protein YhaN